MPRHAAYRLEVEPIVLRCIGDGVTPVVNEERPRRSTFGGNPFWLFGPRPFREQRLRAYIHRQHRAGRTLSEILVDRELEKLGGTTLTWWVVMSPPTIDALGVDACEEIRSYMDSTGRRAV